MKLVVVCPHFAPDVAPTGEVITRIVEELANRGHQLEVITSLPWYRHHRVEEPYRGRMVRTERTPWGRIIRVSPFATADKRNLLRRALSFGGFTALVTLVGLRPRKADVVVSMSPPLTLGIAGWLIARARRARHVFNVQDVFPDVAVEVGAITNRRVIRAAAALERQCYKRSDAVTVLSDDLRENVAGKTKDPEKVRVIPNFVDTQWIEPQPRGNDYRAELGIGDQFVVMYAGNVGFSQSLELFVGAARELRDTGAVFVVNGQGSARPDLEHTTTDLDNVLFSDFQPKERLPQVLSAADLHVVPLRKGLAKASVPSKTYSILAAGRPLVASVDAGTEVARIVEAAGAGLAVPPENQQAFTAAIRGLVADPARCEEMGKNGRRFVERWASPAAIAESYEQLFIELTKR